MSKQIAHGSPRFFWMIIGMVPPVGCPEAQALMLFGGGSLIQNHSLDDVPSCLRVAGVLLFQAPPVCSSQHLPPTVL